MSGRVARKIRKGCTRAGALIMTEKIAESVKKIEADRKKWKAWAIAWGVVSAVLLITLFSGGLLCLYR